MRKAIPIPANAGLLQSLRSFAMTLGLGKASLRDAKGTAAIQDNRLCKGTLKRGVPSLVLSLLLLFLGFQVYAAPSKTVNVYSWAYVFLPDVVKQFENETGIKVNLDVYDSPEVMETKLVTGHSGYDVVMVTVWPYLPKQIEAKLYQPIQRSLISNYKELDPELLKRMEQADPGNRFALPLIWGTTGFAYNKKMILERFPEAPVDSLAMLFDPAVVSRFENCGVMLIDSPVDVFPSVLTFLKKDPNSDSLDDLTQASEKLAEIRPYIRKFQPLPSAADLISKNYCLVEGFSGDLLLAKTLGQESDLEIEYVIPKEGAALWVDGLAIPQDAPHSEEAHAFLNFVLRPDIIAKITNGIEMANSVPSSSTFLKEKIRTNPLIYPSKETMKKLYVDKSHSARYERLRLRKWTRVKIGR